MSFKSVLFILDKQMLNFNKIAMNRYIMPYPMKNVELKLSAPTDRDAIITLAEGSNRFHILNDGSADKLLVCAAFDIC